MVSKCLRLINSMINYSVSKCCSLNITANMLFCLSDLLCNTPSLYYHHDLHVLQGHLSKCFHQPPAGSTPPPPVSRLQGDPVLSYLHSLCVMKMLHINE